MTSGGPGTFTSLAMRMSQRRRLVISGVLGVVACVVVAFLGPWQLAILAGLDVGGIFIVGSVWAFVPKLDAEQTKALASSEDRSAAGDDLVILVASVASLVGVLVALAAADDGGQVLKATMTVAAVVSVVVAWMTVHSVFLLRYARLYYEPPIGGIDFSIDEQPDYLDFAYVAFSVGMTYQVSDTAISSREIRRTVTRHALLAFLFGTVIIGVTINVVGSLVP